MRTPKYGGTSEIRTVRYGHGGEFSGIPFGVFGADKFEPLVYSTPERHSRVPWCSEGAFILDRDVDLHPLTFVIGIERRSVIRIHLMEILFGIAFDCFHGSRIIEQTVAFHHMQSLGEGRPV